MKKIALWIMISAFALSLTACLGTTNGGHHAVKCPSCGYQFDVEKHDSK